MMCWTTRPECTRTRSSLVSSLWAKAKLLKINGIQIVRPLIILPFQLDFNFVWAIETAPPEFDEFLEFLGDKIALKGWTNYSAGLDTIADRTGEFGIYRRWSSTEIMFHVSTFLPYHEDDEQQIGP